MAVPIQAPLVELQPVSVTRQMASALPKLKATAARKGLRLHHLGSGYPHPEVSEPSAYIAHKEAYLRHLARQPGTDPDVAYRALLSSIYNYTDTLGPLPAREAFASVYGRDFGFEMDPEMCIPTVGATGGISLLCSIFERSGGDVAYIVDAPTYTGFVTRARLYQRAHLYSVEMDDEGPHPEAIRTRIREARADGMHVAFYYTVPDGHNPAGISFSQARRNAILDVIREEGIFVVEDAPYTYIRYEDPDSRPKPFVAMDPAHTVHLFTASKIGLPGPRVGFFYSQVHVVAKGGKEASVRDLVLGEASGGMLFHNPEALRGFEAYLRDERFALRDSLWPIAAMKNAVYGENRQIVLDGLTRYLGAFPEDFHWTVPGAGFFTVFTFRKRQVRTTDEFIAHLVSEYGVVTIPMYGFYPGDARARDPGAGLDQLRLSFCFSEHTGEARRQEMREAIRAFCDAIRKECGLPPFED